jgi:hypothetical protein
VPLAGSASGKRFGTGLAAHCVTFWHGSPLGPVERACLRSVLRQGHSLTLYAYRAPIGVPPGVELADAATILPESALFYHRNGSPAVFADWFRYELQRRAQGTWVDADVYLLAPLDGERLYLFGEQGGGVINNAVLRLPPDSELTAALLRVFEQPHAPSWLTAREKLASFARGKFRQPSNPARLPWGATGPRALTALVTELDLVRWALPPAALYPVAWPAAGWIADPRQRLEDVVSDATIAVHLWNELIKPLKARPPPPGSFLERLFREGA